MPSYDYKCEGCEERWEVFHRMSEEGPSECPACGDTRVKRCLSAPQVTIISSEDEPYVAKHFVKPGEEPPVFTGTKKDKLRKAQDFMDRRHGVGAYKVHDTA